MVRGACARHLRDLESGDERGLYFNEDLACRALEFFPDVLRLNGGQFEGEPFELHPSQAFIVGSLFGWLNDQGTRRFRFAYIEQGKGNGKSPLAAGIGIYGMVADGESRAEIYSAATKKDQAMILFRDAVAMVEQSPSLSGILHKSGRGDKVWNLFHPKSNSFFRPISADDGQSGPRPHFGLIDELHEHKSSTVISMMTAGKKWRRQPLVLAITNSGHDKTSVCWEYHKHAKEVCSGAREDDTFFAYVCSLDEGEDPFEDESCWIKANPLLGTIITDKYLRDEVTTARGLPSKESTVRRLNFCEWTEALNPLIPLNLWDYGKSEFTLEKFRDRDCWVGIDLSSTQDLTAAVIVCVIDGVFWWVPMFWTPAVGLRKKSEKDHVPYDVWHKEGWVRTTPGKAIDKDFVVSDIAAVRQEFGLRFVDVPFDKYRIEDLKASCNRQGVTYEGQGAVLPMTDFQQGFISMGPAVDALEVALIAGTIRHDGNPCLRWNAANVVAATDAAGNRKFDKSKATGRIDGIVAGAMAHVRASQASMKQQPKYQMFVV